MKSLKITGLVVAGLSFFNVCSAQELLKGSVDGKSIRMTMDPFAVNRAAQQVQQNTADVSSLLAPPIMFASYGNSSQMLESLDIANLEGLEGDTVHFYVENLSSIFPDEDHELVGLTSGVYTVELTASIQSTTSDEPDTTYTGFVGLAMPGDVTASPEDPRKFTRLASYSFGTDSTLLISQTSLLFVPDSSAVAPVLIKVDDFEDFSNEAPGDPETRIESALLKIVRLGDMSEMETILSD